MTFTPTPFATPVVATGVASQPRGVPYISPSYYRFMPTSVGTNALVPKSAQPDVDSTGSLALAIAQASTWMDDHCFHGSGGSFSSTIVYERTWAKLKPSGALVLLTNQRPRVVVGVALGPSPSQLQDIDANTAADITIGVNSIALPGYWSTGVTVSGTNTVFFGGVPTTGGMVYAVYGYISGYPLVTLADNVEAGASSITVNPPTPGGTVLTGAFAGTALTIKDGASTETVVLAATPSGLVLQLASPTVFAHTVPSAPDAITVTALPSTLERACIHLTNVFLKAQGMRAQVPAAVGSASMPQRQALARAGALADFDVACRLLHPYKMPFVHG